MPDENQKDQENAAEPTSTVPTSSPYRDDETENETRDNALKQLKNLKGRPKRKRR
jgi:hypothetical protein